MSLLIWFPGGFLFRIIWASHFPSPHDPNKVFPGSKRNPGNARGTDRNRRVSAPLSPIFSLLLEPSGKLFKKLQDLLAEDEQAQKITPPIIQHQRPGPRNPAYGLPASEWPTVLHRVLEKNESFRKVAEDYGVSQERIRRGLR